MVKKELTGWLAVLALLLPTAAFAERGRSPIASEIDVRAGSVRASTYQDGSIYVQSGKNKVQLPARHSTRSWYPWRYFPFFRNTSCRGSSSRVYQKTTQTNRSGDITHSSSVSTHTCR